eukprot:scaffold8250_cov118-Skeletonema_dohrnii-CCMP3373.AAC.4
MFQSEQISTPKSQIDVRRQPQAASGKCVRKHDVTNDSPQQLGAKRSPSLFPLRTLRSDQLSHHSTQCC